MVLRSAALIYLTFCASRWVFTGQNWGSQNRIMYTFNTRYFSSKSTRRWLSFYQIWSTFPNHFREDNHPLPPYERKNCLFPKVLSELRELIIKIYWLLKHISERLFSKVSKASICLLIISLYFLYWLFFS